MTPSPGGAAAVRLQNATIGYGDVPIVTGVDLTIGHGEAVAILGSNGSGKTTLARGLLGLAPVLGGEVELLGAPVGRLRERGRVGYVPQRHTVTGAVPATVREVVSVGRLARLGLFRRLGAADRAAVGDAVAAVGLADRMDEPTAGVDAASQEALGDVLARVSAAGTTLLVVTHEAGPLTGVLTRAVVVDHGRISYDGPLSGAEPAAGQHDHCGPPEDLVVRGYRLDQPTVSARPAAGGR